MKKVPLLITCGIIVLLIGGYYVYDQFFNRRPVKPWDLVPSDAVIVYEKDDCNSCIEQFGESMIWRIFETASFYNKQHADSLKKKLSQLVISQPGFLTSLHSTKKDEFDLIYYIPGKTTVNPEFLKNIPHKKTSREFNSVTIEEFKFSNLNFSLAIIEEVWVGSFTPFLIEDVIRTYKSDEKSGFAKHAVSLQPLSRI